MHFVAILEDRDGSTLTAPGNIVIVRDAGRIVKERAGARVPYRSAPMKPK